jgi:type II secretory pathway component GspD/PulD (secretin)
MRNARRCAAGILAFLGACAAAGGAPTETGGKVRPGDLLYVEVYRVPEMSRAYLVGEDGAVRMPYIPPVSVGGMDETTAATSISKALESIMRSPRVSVSRSNLGMATNAPGRASDMRLEIIPLRNSNAESMSLALKGMASPGGSVSADPDTNSLLLTDTPEAIKNMMSVVARIDQMQSQVTQVRIETKVAEVRVGAMKELGVRWFAQGDNVGGGFIPPANSLSPLAGRKGGLGPQANEFINKNDGNQTNNPLQREFVGDTFDRRLNIPVTVPIPGQTFLGYTAGGIDLGAMIDALVTDQKARLLADPTIVTVNHKPAQIKMVDEYPYLEFGTEISGRSISSVKFMELGIVLDVTPHVYQDTVGTYVKLDLRPEVSFPSGIVNGTPIRSLRSSSTIANVRDGQTLVVGGIITEDEQNVVTKVPGIGDMPILGNLFKTKEKTKFRTELMIFVTPTVHRRPEEITWDRMIDVAEGLNEQALAPGDLLRQEARKD